MAILTEDLLEPRSVKFKAQAAFNFFLGNTKKLGVPRDRTPKAAVKSLEEFYKLVDKALKNYQDRANVPKENRVTFTEEDLDKELDTEVITVKCIKRVPGAFSAGAPFEGKIVNLRPLLRKEEDDPKNPGYRVLTSGYFYDNIVRLTAWARTNKRANFRAQWFETFMEEYSWYFKAEGVDRTIFIGRREDEMRQVSENKWYGRPFDFFVRTEKVRVFNEKSLEEIIVEFVVEGVK